MSTARCGHRTTALPAFIVSISPPAGSRLGSRSRTRASRTISMTWFRTRRTTPISPTSASVTLGGSMPRPARSNCSRCRRRRRHREQFDLAGLGIDPPNVTLAKVGEIGVVLRVRNHVIDIVRLARVLERLPSLDPAGGDIETMNAGKAVVLCPHLAVDMGALRAHHIDLRGVDVLLALQRPEPERLGLAVEFHDRGLIHVAKPQIAVAIAAQI